MQEAHARGLVSAAWLQQYAHQVVVLDARFHLPNAPVSALQAYASGHIEGARWFDHNTIRDTTSDLPTMLPFSHDFAQHMGALGLRREDTVVVYDADTKLGAARAWWMLTIFGHERVYVLDGGLAAWQRAGGRVTTLTPTWSPTTYPLPTLHRPWLASKEEVDAAIAEQSATLLDARSPARFSGQEKEPRADMRSGHIEGSLNVHYQRFYQADGTMLPASSLRALFTEAGVNPAAPIIATCGSGISACTISLARYVLGYEPATVYDGSWAEYGRKTHF